MSVVFPSCCDSVDSAECGRRRGSRSQATMRVLNGPFWRKPGQQRAAVSQALHMVEAPARSVAPLVRPCWTPAAVSRMEIAAVSM